MHASHFQEHKNNLKLMHAIKTRRDIVFSQGVGIAL